MSRAMNRFTNVAARARAWPVWARYGAATFLVAAGTYARAVLAGPAPGYPYIAYFLPVLLSAVLFGRGPGIATTVACTALALWLFVAPAGEPWARTPVDVAASFAFLCGGLALAIAVDAAFRGFLALRTVLEGIGEPFYVVDADWRVAYASRAALEVWGRRSDEVIGRRLRDALPEAAGSAPLAALEEAMRTRQVRRLEAISTVVGRWIEVDIYPTREGGLSVAFRDAQERRAAQERQRLLVAELTHRIKNSLAVVLAIADQTRRSAPSPAAFHAVFQERITALARAHDALLRDGGAGTTLEAVARESLAPFGTDAGRLTIAGPRVRIGADIAIALGMVFHELGANAAKHGALSASTGRVRLTWSSVADGEGRACHDLLWEESDGPPIPAPPTHRGFGTRLLERALAAQAGATVRLEFNPAGLRCRIRIPSADPAHADSRAHAPRGGGLDAARQPGAD